MEQPQPIPELSSETPKTPVMSLGGRLLNVFATPGDVFDDVKATPPSTANWLIPGIILIAISWVGALLIFSQDSITHQMSEITDQAIQKQVAAGHLSEQQAEQSRSVAEKWSGIVAKIIAALAPLMGAFVTPFFWGVVIWLIGAKLLKGDFPYMKAVEVVGLANMIGVLHGIVKTLLIVGLGNLYASPSLVLLVKEFDPQNTLHSLLAIVNVMTFWELAVWSIGLARLSGVSFTRAALWVFGIWAAYTGFFVGLGLALKAVFKHMGA